MKIRIPICDRCSRHDADCPCFTRLDPLARRREQDRVAAEHRDAVERAATPTTAEWWAA